MSKDRFLPQRIRQISQATCTQHRMQSQQRSRGVSTDFDRFITHHAPLEPISVVRFVRSCGWRHHSLRQLRCVPLPVNVWSTETYDKRAPGDICCINTDFNSIGTMHRAVTPQNMLRERVAVFDLSTVAATPTTDGWLVQKVPFHIVFVNTTLLEVYPPFVIPIDQRPHILKGCVPTRTFCFNSIQSSLFLDRWREHQGFRLGPILVKWATIATKKDLNLYHEAG